MGRDSLLLQTPESLGKSLALDVRTGQDVFPGRSSARPARRLKTVLAPSR
jgi:hypothetical protein